MNVPSITWQGESIDDVEILRELPVSLVNLLREINGFILHQGALHVRGASLARSGVRFAASGGVKKHFMTFMDSCAARTYRSLRTNLVTSF